MFAVHSVAYYVSSNTVGTVRPRRRATDCPMYVRTTPTATPKPTVGTGVLDCPSYVRTVHHLSHRLKRSTTLSLLLWEKGDHEVVDEESSL